MPVPRSPDRVAEPIQNFTNVHKWPPKSPSKGVDLEQPDEMSPSPMKAGYVPSTPNGTMGLASGKTDESRPSAQSRMSSGRKSDRQQRSSVDREETVGKVYSAVSWQTDEDFEAEQESSKKKTRRVAPMASRMSSARNSVTFDTETWTGYMRLVSFIIITHSTFDKLMGVIIIANTLSIGLERTLTLDGKEGEANFLRSSEHFFLSAYIVEISLRFMGLGLRCLRDNWVKCDFVLVITGCSTTWLLEPLLSFDLNLLFVLRMARLLRLARTARLLIKFPELWMLIRGMTSSASTMFYTLVLLTIMLYVFSCIAIELMVEHQPEELIRDTFSRLPQAMLTLLQFVTADSMAGVYRPLIRNQPVLLLYFIPVILIVTIVLMNLITAVVVQTALEQASQDKEMVRNQEQSMQKRVLRDMRKMFNRLDEDGSGNLTLEELLNGADEDKEGLSKLLNAGHRVDPVEIFTALDCQNNGYISIDEFCGGVYEMTVAKTPIHTQRMEKQVNLIFHQLQDMRAVQLEILERINGPQSDPRDSVSSSSRPCTLSGQNLSIPETPAWAEDLSTTLRLELEAMTEGLGTALDQIREDFHASFGLHSREVPSSKKRLSEMPSDLRDAAVEVPRSVRTRTAHGLRRSVQAAKEARTTNGLSAGKLPSIELQRAEDTTLSSLRRLAEGLLQDVTSKSDHMTQLLESGAVRSSASEDPILNNLRKEFRGFFDDLTTKGGHMLLLIEQGSIGYPQGPGVHLPAAGNGSNGQRGQPFDSVTDLSGGSSEPQGSTCSKVGLKGLSCVSQQTLYMRG
mmetsp:Transcript_18970/g.41403  ORF Transcript_18970/g.41403 Transcript_18970/m.41403 type:complete len:797 (+) Transcript_18970:64-2454(+)